ncbi:Cupredoxin superfamily protein [Heracleum sosnowskyi]|uniref:Cupredoxin superfamily protein n=1 Tax=Heracleum sosnowskyi TaxID=360622 RepID=A0AAD8JKR9_9APIA|nr:Cupredoxin superfamily protein [Heracleum sosnowskyi]
MITSCVAFDFSVGDLPGWTLGIDFDFWSAGKNFIVGDNLVFRYSKGHTVIEVSLAEYTSCALENSTSKLSWMHKSDTAVITLETPGAHYFISGEPGQCNAGMKIAINVSPNGESATSTPTCDGCPPLAPPDRSSNAHALNLPWKNSGSARAGLSNVPPFVAVLVLALVLL